MMMKGDCVCVPAWCSIITKYCSLFTCTVSISVLPWEQGHLG